MQHHAESGELDVHWPSWRFDPLQEAHAALDETRANGKMVVVIA